MANILKNKKIIIGITGSISAYKTPLLIRDLIKLDAHINTIMTPSAKNFVTTTVLSNLSKNPVVVDMFDDSMQNSGAWHIQLAHWCDAMLISPCSATTLARLSIGLCDTALTTVALAIPGNIPLIIAPAMDSTMWEHPATQRNIKRLKEDGAIIIPPEVGELSSGLIGAGRLPEVETIIEALRDVFSNNFENNEDIRKKTIQQEKKKPQIINKSDNIDTDKLNAEINLAEMKSEKEKPDYKSSFKGKKVLISAGPTYEKIDDVRFIGNFSSGKMGFALAEEMNDAGADVVLVSGPVSLDTPMGIKRIDVESASEMYKIVINEFTDCEIAILSAAVADYTPMEKHSGKIKKEKTGSSLSIELKSTEDILYTLGTKKQPNQKLIGFALESSNEINNGWKKLKTKNCNMIVVNLANKPRSGFGGDDNTITILTRNGTQKSYEAMSKKKCAQEILKEIMNI